MPDSTRHDRTSRIVREVEHVGAQQINQSELARLFDEWMEGDEAEQRETFEWPRHSLEEYRPAGYKLFVQQ